MCWKDCAGQIMIRQTQCLLNQIMCLSTYTCKNMQYFISGLLWWMKNDMNKNEMCLSVLGFSLSKLRYAGLHNIWENNHFGVFLPLWIHSFQASSWSLSWSTLVSDNLWSEFNSNRKTPSHHLLSFVSIKHKITFMIIFSFVCQRLQ